MRPLCFLVSLSLLCMEAVSAFGGPKSATLHSTSTPWGVSTTKASPLDRVNVGYQPNFGIEYGTSRREKMSCVVLRAAAASKDSSGSPPKIIISGAPASGKGTQCEMIKEKYGLVHLSTGDMLRAAVAAKTEVGIAAKEYMDSGKLVPDEVIIGIVRSDMIAV
jgi:hypothetical protein